MTTLIETHYLGELALAANREHVRCEQALGAAIEHAFRAGKYLLAAKGEVAHGRWAAWLGANFAGSVRTAQRYMQVAREIEDPSRVSYSSLREALEELSTPRQLGSAEETEEVIGAELVVPPRMVFDHLRKDEAAMADAAEEIHAEEERRRGDPRFQRTGAERAAVRQIRAALREADRYLKQTTQHDSSPWTRAEAFEAAGYAHKRASELERDLAKSLHRELRDPNR